MGKIQQKKVLSVIIPVYNEEEFATALLDKVLHAKISVSMEIIIVNDGSTDNSAQLCQEWVRTHKGTTPHKLIYLEKPNGGKGSAVKLGIAHSTGDVVIIQDADLEYDPADYEKCIAPILHGECSVVYGSREKDNRNRLFSSPFFFLGGLLLTWWIDLLYNAELTDEPTCYKTFSGPLIRSIPLKGDRFDWEPEITAKLLRLGFEIREVPISYYPRKTAEGKKIRFRDGFAGLMTALFWRFASLKKIRKQCAEISGDFQKVIRGRKYSNTCFIGIFLLAFLLRAACALPGLLSPGQQCLKYADSYPFLAMAGAGIFQEKPKLCTPYPSGFRKLPERSPDPAGAVPQWQRTMKDQTRAPLYVIWLSAVFGISARNLVFAALAGCLLGALSCAFAFLAGKMLGALRCGVLAGLFMALHPTAVLYGPVFLPDTLFLLTITLQIWFFLRFVRNGFGLNLVAAVLFAALGALIRPVNALWILPCIVTLFFCKKVHSCLRINYMVLSLVLFAPLLLGRMWISHEHGLGYRIDSISSEALMKNTSHLESSLRKIPRHKILQEYHQLLTEKFSADPERYKTLGAQLYERDRLMFSKLLKHPFHALAHHFNLRILEPDLTGFMIRFPCHDLQKRKLLAYSLNTFYRVWLLLTLLGVCWYFLAQGSLSFLMKTILFLSLCAYYLFLPGAIADSRYLLPALPFLVLSSAFGLTYLYALAREQKQPGGF